MRTFFASLLFLSLTTLAAADELPQHFDVSLDESTAKLAARLTTAMARQLDWNYAETPLREVAEDLSKRLEAPFALDDRGLDEVGINGDSPITFQAKRLAARTAVKYFLAQQGLTFIPREGRLLITNADSAPPMLRLHPIAPLGMKVLGGRSEAGREADAVAHLLQELFFAYPPGLLNGFERSNFESPESPNTPAAFAVLDDRALTAVMPFDRQLEVERFFAAIYRAKRLLTEQPANFPAEGVDVFETDSIREKLGHNLRIKVQGTLAEMAAEIEQRLKIHVLIAERDLDEVGASRDSETRGEFTDVPARQVLRALLRPLGLTFYVTSDAIVISNPDAAGKHATFRLLHLPARRKSDFPREFPTIELAGQRLLVFRGTEEETEQYTAVAAALRRIEAWEAKPSPAGKSGK